MKACSGTMGWVPCAKVTSTSLTGFLLQGSFASFWSLVMNSGAVAKMVLLVLLGFSVLSWAIMIKKYRIYKQVETQSQGFHEEFQRLSSLSEIYRECELYPMSPLAGIPRGSR